jgi:hypothetical protein
VRCCRRDITHTTPITLTHRFAAMASHPTPSSSSSSSSSSDSEHEVKEVKGKKSSAATTVSGSSFASSSSAAAPNPRRNPGKRALLLRHFTLVQGTTGSYSCNSCVESGVEMRKASGYRLGEFGIDHAKTVHPKDAAMQQAAALFPKRTSRKKLNMTELVSRQNALDVSSSVSGMDAKRVRVQTTLDGHFVSLNATLDSEECVFSEAAKFMIRLKMAPHAVPLLQDLSTPRLCTGLRPRAWNASCRPPSRLWKRSWRAIGGF